MTTQTNQEREFRSAFKSHRINTEIDDISLVNFIEVESGYDLYDSNGYDNEGYDYYGHDCNGLTRQDLIRLLKARD